MGYFKNIEIEVIEMYDDGYDFTEIAKELKISVADVGYIILNYEDGDYDDSMDGDAESALASAGFGTDEDYGYYGE